MQDDSGCCGGGGDGIATGDGRGRDGLTLCLESACPVLGGASTVARRDCGPRRPRSVTGYLCLCSTRLRGTLRNCGQLWACANMLSSPGPFACSIPMAYFCISCLGALDIPFYIISGVPHLLAALHNHSRLCDLTRKQLVLGEREHSAMMVRFNIKANESDHL